MDKAAGTPHRTHRGRVSEHKVMKELQEMIDDGRVDAGRVIAFVKEKSKRTVGRPAYPEDQRRTKMVHLRVTQRERTALEKAAKGKGMSLSDFLRHLVSRHI